MAAPVRFPHALDAPSRPGTHGNYPLSTLGATIQIVW